MIETTVTMRIDRLRIDFRKCELLEKLAVNHSETILKIAKEIYQVNPSHLNGWTDCFRNLSDMEKGFLKEVIMESLRQAQEYVKPVLDAKNSMSETN